MEVGQDPNWGCSAKKKYNGYCTYVTEYKMCLLCDVSVFEELYFFRDEFVFRKDDAGGFICDVKIVSSVLLYCSPYSESFCDGLLTTFEFM
jgi:hypothetical protein